MENPLFLSSGTISNEFNLNASRQKFKPDYSRRRLIPPTHLDYFSTYISVSKNFNSFQSFKPKIIRIIS